MCFFETDIAIAILVMMGKMFRGIISLYSKISSLISQRRKETRKNAHFRSRNQRLLTFFLEYDMITSWQLIFDNVNLMLTTLYIAAWVIMGFCRVLYQTSMLHLKRYVLTHLTFLLPVFKPQKKMMLFKVPYNNDTCGLVGSDRL